MPGLLEDFDTISSTALTPEAKAVAFASLLDRVIVQVNHLFSWRWCWERLYGDAAWLVPASPSSCVPRDQITGEPLFSTLVYFTSFIHAHEVTGYNSVLCILFDLAYSICSDDSYLTKVDRSIPPDLQHTTRRSPLCLPSDPELSLHTAAAEHVRSVQYVLSEEKHIAASGLFLLLSLDLTYKALPINDPLTSWIRRICRQISTLSGFKVGSTFKPAQMMTKELQWSKFYPAGSDD